MPVTDPVADMLTRIRNAQQVKKSSVTMPSSKVKVAIATVLKDEGYIDSFDVSEEAGKAQLNIALNYGGQQEIIRAAQKLAEHVANGDMKPEDIDRKAFESELYTAGLPDVDFLIRTSGEMRLSNFLLYQLAYAEFYQTDTLWPDFDRHAYDEALLAYAKRNRRFGGV